MNFNSTEEITFLEEQFLRRQAKAGQYSDSWKVEIQAPKVFDKQMILKRLQTNVEQNGTRGRENWGREREKSKGENETPKIDKRFGTK